MHSLCLLGCPPCRRLPLPDLFLQLPDELLDGDGGLALGQPLSLGLGTVHRSTHKAGKYVRIIQELCVRKMEPGAGSAARPGPGHCAHVNKQDCMCKTKCVTRWNQVLAQPLGLGLGTAQHVNTQKSTYIKNLVCESSEQSSL